MPSPVYHSRSTVLFTSILLFLRGSEPYPTIPHPAASAENARFSQLSARIYQLTAAGKYGDAIPLYENAATQAQQAGVTNYAQKFLNNLGACEIALFRYRDALNNLEKARSLSGPDGDPKVKAGLDLNISSLFLQLGNTESAGTAAERGLAGLAPGADASQRAKLLIQLAIVRARQNDLRAAEGLFQKGIDVAYDALDPATAAWGWDYLGSEYRVAGRLAEAGRALTESFRLRTLFHLSPLNSLWQLALVRADQGDVYAASILIDNAVLALKRPDNITPEWNVYGARGRIRLLAGRPAEALEDLRTARSLSRAWRAGIIANDVSRTTTESRMSVLIYSSLVEAGNQVYEATHNPLLARETFEATEENRAASLRALTANRENWQARLPAQYWDQQAQLQAAELRLVWDKDPKIRYKEIAVRANLERMEAAAGSPEGNDHLTALAHAQEHLSSDSVLFSFQLGEEDSWMWSVTQNQFAVYRLPPRAALADAIDTFQTAIRERRSDAAADGAALYQTLFSQVPAPILSKRSWLLSLDEDLFKLPFPALVSATGDRSPIYLAQIHSVQITSGALMLQKTAARSSFAHSFLGIGDPVYNRADPRWKGNRPSTFLSREDQRVESGAFFARLWGSGVEIRSAARTWNAPVTVLLTGPEANKSHFWREISRRPSIIHFASHILEEPDAKKTGWIALSLNGRGESEFISPAEISARSVPAELVVLSGCSSGSAEVRTASGLMGLTRAFIAAGAGNVLATRWPARDDNGEFLALFYQKLRESPEEGPARALQQARREVIRYGDWRSEPAFWASYFVTGNN